MAQVGKLAVGKQRGRLPVTPAPSSGEPPPTGWTGAPRAGSPLLTNGPTSDSTSLTINLAPHDVDDLLIVILGTDSNASVSCTGWTAVYTGTNSTNVRLSIFVRDTLAASDSETDPTFTISNTQQGSGLAYSIPGGDPAKVAVGAGFAVADANPNAPSVTSGVTADHLFIACFAADNNSSLSVSSYPSGYTNGASGWNGNSGGVLVGAAEKSTTGTTSDDPGSFTLSGSEQHVANSIALWP